VLLSRGLECLERLFRGFEAGLVAVGVPVVEGSESLWMNAAGWCRRYQSPIRLLGASRELIEWQARTRITGLDNVRLLEGCGAVGLLVDPDLGAVTGVRLRSRSGRVEGTGGDTEVPAEFVVDASGRGSQAPQWLAALGYQPPPETSINPLLGYASRQYRIPAGFRAGPAESTAVRDHPIRRATVPRLRLSQHRQPATAFRTSTPVAGAGRGGRRRQLLVQPDLRAGHDRGRHDRGRSGPRPDRAPLQRVRVAPSQAGITRA
jgi:hypothetical protein